MKNLLLILLNFFFLQNAFAQEKKDTTEKKESRWSMGFSVAPNYSYRKIYSDEAFAQYYIYYRNKHDIPDYGYGIYIMMDYKISKIFTICTGLT